MNEQPIWTPSDDRMRSSRMARFLKQVNDRWGVNLFDYAGLHRWSITEPAEFWRSVWDFCGLIGEPGTSVVDHWDRMPGALWFPEGRLNFAENLLRDRGASDALVFWGEDRIRRRISHSELYRQTASLAAAFRGIGLAAGDVVAAYMPNIPETVVGMLAAASIGAVFSSCSPDFGVVGAVDRFRAVKPKVLLAADGYYFNGKVYESAARNADIAALLPSIEQVVLVSYLRDEPAAAHIRNAVSLADFVSPYSGETQVPFQRLSFNHLLYVLYSSGTTGPPKSILHGSGGTLLQHVKEHQLHCDINPGDRVFYYTTCGWMMWNWLVSALASGAALMLYDGSPLFDQGRILFDYAEAEGITHFGVSAKFIDAIARNGISPMDTHSLSGLRSVLSTGSPLAPEGFDYVYRHIKSDVSLASISGGTDIISCFGLGSPLLPVWRGEIQAPGLGMAVEVFDEAGGSVRRERGELVCTRPFPSMPLGFLDDETGAKYRSAYFDRYAGVWAHGDYAEITGHGGLIIHGRSDAALNPGGVRIGTAEIYRQVERLPEVLESLAIGQEWAGDVRIVLFVRLRDGCSLYAALVDKIKREIRQNATPRHVPAIIIQVADLPRTRTGKLAELAVSDVVHGREVRNKDALANPESLSLFSNIPELSAPM